MKKIALLLALGISTLAYGQQYAVQWQTGNVIPVEKSFALSPSEGEVVNHRYYRIIQFYQIPTDREKAALEATGIRLYNYLPNYSYMASIPVGYSSSGLSSHRNVRSVFPIAATQKLSADLEPGKYPAYALKENNQIELIVLHHPDIPTSQVAEMLAQQQITVSFQLPEQNGLRILAQKNAVTTLAQMAALYFIEPYDANPLPEDLTGSTNHRSNTIATAYSGGLKYDGTGVSVALNDDGVIGPHIDYQGRLINQYISFNNGDHGDHCGGIIFGAANMNPTARGMAFGANLGVYGVSSSFANTYQAFDSIYNHYNTNEIRITSTSYGDGNNAGYTSRARLMDQQINTMPELIHVFSAGNSGTSNFGYGAGAGWGNITGGHKQAKNVIAVGNLSDVDVLASSSSRGPAKDGRIKPDICAVGTNVYSTMDVNAYQYLSGTSMACPGVSGVLAQLYHAYKDLHNNAQPPSSLMKAIVLNTADDLGNSGPDFRFGYGRINARRAYGIIENNQYSFDSVSQGATKTHTISVPAGTAEVRIMVYWHDKEATAGALKALVNNLDISVQSPSAQTFLPWVLNSTPTATALNSLAVRGVDSLNNVEQVTINTPAAGNYTLSVSGTAVPFGPQKYVVVYEFVKDEITVTYPMGGESLVPGTSEIIRWDAYGNTGNFTASYSLDSGITWNTLSTTIGGSLRYFYWTVPNVVSGKALVRISRGAASDVSDSKFSIIGVPSSLTVNWVCLDSFKVSYTGVTGATGYIVTVLGNKYMDSAAISPTNSCVVHGMNTLQSGWYSVQATGPDGCIGRRAIAKARPAVPYNCSVVDDLELVRIDNVVDTLQQYCDIASYTDSPSVVISNNGLAPMTNTIVSYSVNGGAVISDTLSAAIPVATQVTHQFTTPIVYTASGAHTIQIWISNTGDNNGINDTLTIIKQILPPVTMSVPFIENFETFNNCDTTANCSMTVCALTGGWRNASNATEDDIDWRVLTGPTPSAAAGGQTGPSIDYIPGSLTGHYLYLESDSCSSKRAELISPCIDLTGVTNQSLKFAYHLYGSGMGSLHVDVFSSGQWTNDILLAQAGNQGNVWKTATVSLSNYDGKIINLRFRGITGTNGKSDMAIDAVRITTPNSISETGIAAAVQIYPNPTKGLLQVTLPKGKSQLRLVDVQGREVYRQTTENTTETLSLQALPSGMYYLHIVHETGSITRKVTKY